MMRGARVVVGGGESCHSDVNRMQLDDVSPLPLPGGDATRVTSAFLPAPLAPSSLHPSIPGTTSESGLISASDGS